MLYEQEDTLASVVKGIITFRAANINIGTDNLVSNNQDSEQETNSSSLEITDWEAFLCKSCTKFVRDELSAAISYIRLANVVKSPYVSKELKEHANEEFEHYTEIIEYLTKHGLDVKFICLDKDVVNNIPNGDKNIIEFVQALETKALNDYKAMVALSKKFNDVESCEFFKELMKDEIEHFDDLSNLIGQVRRIVSSEQI